MKKFIPLAVIVGSILSTSALAANETYTFSCPEASNVNWKTSYIGIYTWSLVAQAGPTSNMPTDLYGWRTPDTITHKTNINPYSITTPGPRGDKAKLSYVKANYAQCIYEIPFYYQLPDEQGGGFAPTGEVLTAVLIPDGRLENYGFSAGDQYNSIKATKIKSDTDGRR